MVAAGHVLALDPSAQTVERGAQAVYSVDLTNPSATNETFTVRAIGLEAFEVELAAAVMVPAGQTVHLPLTVTVPASAAEGEKVFSVVAETASGGLDTVEGRLRVAGGSSPPPPPPVVLETRAVQITRLPTQSLAGPETSATVQVLVTNVGDTVDTYALTGTSPPGFAAVFAAPTVPVPPGLCAKHQPVESASTVDSLSDTGASLYHQPEAKRYGWRCPGHPHDCRARYPSTSR